MSALAFATLFGLAAQHAVGSSKRRVVASERRVPRVAEQGVHFFDERGDGFAFADPPPAADPPQASAPPEPPPVAETSAS